MSSNFPWIQLERHRDAMKRDNDLQPSPAASVVLHLVSAPCHGSHAFCIQSSKPHCDDWRFRDANTDGLSRSLHFEADLREICEGVCISRHISASQKLFAIQLVIGQRASAPPASFSIEAFEASGSPVSICNRASMDVEQRFITCKYDIRPRTAIG